MVVMRCCVKRPIINKKMLKVVIICCVNENGDGANQRLADRLSAVIHADITTVLIGREATSSRILKELREAAAFLATGKERRVVVYYNGHGDQTRDVSGDEEDGRDELWKPAGGGRVIDDQITQILNSYTLMPDNTLLLISDSCSSGSMLDAIYSEEGSKNWIAIGSCQDPQDSFASSEGGIFTLFGLIPFLDSVNKGTLKGTARELTAFIDKAISIPSQKISVTTGDQNILSRIIFTSSSHTHSDGVAAPTLISKSSV
jgi:hypothetical protein